MMVACLLQSLVPQKVVCSVLGVQKDVCCSPWCPEGCLLQSLVSLSHGRVFVHSARRSRCQRCPSLQSLRQERLCLVHILACSCSPCCLVHLAVSSSSTCWPTHTCVLYLVSVSASCIRALTMPCLSVSCLHIVSVSVSCSRTYPYDGAYVCVWHRLVRPCLWCTCERACVTILFSPSQTPEVGYPHRPQLKQKQQAARTSTAQPRIKLNVSAMTWPTAGNVIAPAIRPSTSVMDILPDRPQFT